MCWMDCDPPCVRHACIMHGIIMAHTRISLLPGCASLSPLLHTFALLPLNTAHLHCTFCRFYHTRAHTGRWAWRSRLFPQTTPRQACWHSTCLFGLPSSMCHAYLASHYIPCLACLPFSLSMKTPSNQSGMYVCGNMPSLMPAFSQHLPPLSLSPLWRNSGTVPVLHAAALLWEVLALTSARHHGMAAACLPCCAGLPAPVMCLPETSCFFFCTAWGGHLACSKASFSSFCLGGHGMWQAGGCA